jgi:signal transduction histidine kinase
LTKRRIEPSIGGMTGEPWLRSAGGRAGIYFLLASVLGLLSASVVLTTEWSSGLSKSPAMPLLLELSGAYTFLLLLPAVLAFIRRFPISRANWARRLPLHLGFSLVFGASHTLLMWGSRSVLFRVLGWGEFDYGLMRYRFLMEYQKQLLAYGLLYGVVAFVGYVRRSRESELRAAALRSQLSEARLEALKMQLNPHFLFNTLNMISAHVHAEPDRADTMISHLSDFLRGTLRHSERQEIPLEQELELLHPYLEIMKARFESRLQVTLDMAPDCHRALVPHMLLQPIVENAVAHGVEGGTGHGRVQVSARRAGGELEIIVQDDGPGLSRATAAGPGRGVGLGNTERRLFELYGEAQRLELTDAPGGGLRVRLVLPWRAESELATA